MSTLEVAAPGLILAQEPPDVLDLSLVLPTYNESAHIDAIVEQLIAVLGGIPALRYEIIVVDDNSPDRTWEKGLQLSRKFPQVHAIRRQDQRDVSTAVLRGWQIARGEVFAVMDADLQHPPETITELWRAMRRGADLAVASRNVEGGGVSDWTLPRRIVSRCAQLLGLVVLPEVTGKVSDPMSGYFMVRRSALEGRELHPLGYKILVEVLARGAVEKISEVPYVFRETPHRPSKHSAAVFAQYLQHLIRIRIHLLKTSTFVRFCIVGASGTLIDTAMLFLLSDPRTLNWNLTGSKIIAAELALTNNFIWNDLWTFGKFSSCQNTLRQRARRFLKFNLLCSVGIILNIIILNIGFKVFHVNRYIANLSAIFVVTFWNYNTNRKLSWRTTAKE
ncbi:MAG TPA: glycosyltransferase [Candidatus Acidoferrum sp.]|jgi:dolichol-phosphate mannosyltransferase|nr:glycosyltransferase [Candidatus Acidoferrum sp.]